MLCRYAPAVCALVLLATSLRVGGADESPTGAPQEFLVLRNGEVLSGKVSRDGDRYVVTGDGSQMRFPSREVDFTCRSLDEAYSIQERRIVKGRIDDHLNLADWCLKQELTGYAARELSAAMAIDARHPRVALLDSRLQRAIEGQSRAASDQMAESSTEPEADKSNSVVSAAELERQMRSMPLGTVETFTTSIQPILLRSCATAGCHGAGSTSSFTLLRPPIGSPMPRRMTQRNLSETLQWIDRQQPLESKLLASAKDPHGPNQESGAVGLNPAKYQELTAWVWQTCNGKVRSPTTLATPERAPQPAQQSSILAASVEAKQQPPGTATRLSNSATKNAGDAKRPSQPILTMPAEASSQPTGSAQGQPTVSGGNITASPN